MGCASVRSSPPWPNARQRTRLSHVGAGTSDPQESVVLQHRPVNDVSCPTPTTVTTTSILHQLSHKQHCPNSAMHRISFGYIRFISCHLMHLPHPPSHKDTRFIKYPTLNGFTQRKCASQSKISTNILHMSYCFPFGNSYVTRFLVAT